MTKVCQWKAEQIIFLDESACSGRTVNRRWGWSPRGYACRVKETSIRSSRYSILPALSIDGYIAIDIFEGSYNKERFNSFVANHVLPKMNSESLSRSVLVIDNTNSYN